jgi:hypothetical protein
MLILESGDGEEREENQFLFNLHREKAAARRGWGRKIIFRK